LRQEKKKQQKDKDSNAMDVDTKEPSTSVAMEIDTKSEVKNEKTPSENAEKKDIKNDEKETKPSEEKPAEPDFEILSNPARVTRAQLSKITFDVDPRYVPITEGIHGIVLLEDKTPGEAEDIIPGALPTSAGAGVLEDEANEPEAPPPFEFLGK